MQNNKLTISTLRLTANPHFNSVQKKPTLLVSYHTTSYNEINFNISFKILLLDDRKPSIINIS